MVAKNFSLDPRQKRAKNYIGQDLQEQALASRGDISNRVATPLKPTPPAVSKSAAAPVKRPPSQFAPSGSLRQRTVNSGPGYNPALSSKPGPIKTNSDWYNAALRRLRKVTK